MDPDRRTELRYREQVPLSKPGPGEQYAFDVDLDACTGCKSCVSACHTMNGLDEHETWRKVGLLHGGRAGAPWQQTVTTACHHCVDPACLAGCPALAYDKDPVTGIVVHLDDQCIGCRYCTLTCPYDVPQWNPLRGIVRKCDMCHERLAGGDKPACVEACPNGAIAIAVVAQEQVIAANEGRAFLPAAPDPTITQPTTTYRSARPAPRDAIPADHYAVRAEEAHPPLAVMLVLTQLAVGTFAIAQLVDVAGGAAVAVALGLVALGASLLHLGRPHLAFRAVLGLRRSWLSREIVAFGGFAAAAALAALRPSPALGAIAAGLGIAGVACSVMVYAATRRASWSVGITGAKFALTTAILGAATAHVLTDDPRVAHGFIATLGAKLALELALLARARDRHHGALQRSARLQLGPLRRVLATRLALGAGALAIALADPGVIAAAAALVCALAGELCERHLFFVAVGSPRMPGGVR
jgi:Fe-S-cluster-containing dehydrogenase component/DMSO reductase anchor subunit